MSHNHHPAIREHGLQDNCPRCAEIADDPWIGMDDDNLLLLVARTRAWMKDQEYPRSDTELKAMRNTEQTLQRMNRLAYIEDKQKSDALFAQDKRDKLKADALEAAKADAEEPTDDDIYNRSTGPYTGVEGGIAYDTTDDQPGSLGENDWRL